MEEEEVKNEECMKEERAKRKMSRRDDTERVRKA